MKLVACLISIASLSLGFGGLTTADVITDWNDKVVTAGVKASQAPFVHTRSAAIVHVAMFDAVNSIDRRYTPYRVQSPAAPGTSREAAAAAAAHFALVRLYPDQVKGFRQLLSNVAGNGAGRAAEVERYPAWRAVAAEILALRAKDGANAPNTYRPYTGGRASTFPPLYLSPPVGDK